MNARDIPLTPIPGTNRQFRARLLWDDPYKACAQEFEVEICSADGEVLETRQVNIILHTWVYDAPEDAQNKWAVIREADTRHILLQLGPEVE